MLTELDSELFPEDCVVVEMPLHNQWVYQIFKNGWTSIQKEHLKNGYRIYRNEEIQQLFHIDIYLREPFDRYVSGINTYAQYLKRESPHLDFDTIVWMALRYKFLNRHYLPQWHWLLNLNRFTGSDTKLRLRRFEDLHLITENNRKAVGVNVYSQEFIDKISQGCTNMELWFYLDQVLRDLSGKTMTWVEILDHYRRDHTELYQLICQNVLQ